MRYLKTYLQTITDRGNIRLAESIATTAEDVGNQHIKNFSFCSHEIGLLFGNVQSGKTGQMFGIICKAADMGFPAFVLLTTDNVVLQQQTLNLFTLQCWLPLIRKGHLQMFLELLQR